jgi:hypothetical protein
VGCVQALVSEWSLSTLPSPILELQHAPLPLKVLWVKEHAPTPPSSVIFYLDSHLSLSRSWECVNRSQIWRFEQRDYVYLYQITSSTLDVIAICQECYCWRAKMVKHGRTMFAIVHHVIFTMWMAKLTHP